MQSSPEDPNLQSEVTSSAKDNQEVMFPVSVNWVDAMQFVASDERNHSLVLDANLESGGNQTGPTPGKLLLMAVAGCTAMDVISILRKSRQKVTGLTVRTRGVQNEVHPQYYKEIYLRYTVKGKALERSRVERAIRLSEEKYCVVSQTVNGKAKIFVEYQIVEDDDTEPQKQLGFSTISLDQTPNGIVS